MQVFLYIERGVHRISWLGAISIASQSVCVEKSKSIARTFTDMTEDAVVKPLQPCFAESESSDVRRRMCRAAMTKQGRRY